MLKIFLLLSLVLTSLSAAQLQQPHKDLEAIEHYAVKMGSGDGTKMYIFVDPLCPHSRALVKKIYENKMLQLVNSYYLMFYKLPRFDSEKTMHYILEQPDRKEALVKIMVKEESIDLEAFKTKSSITQALKAISDVAATLKMTQRPYMISFEKDSKYCRVSEGSVSCLEELED